MRKLREELVLKQEEIAKALGVSPNTISRWERGERFPTIDNIRKIAEFFNLTPQEVRRMLTQEQEQTKMIAETPSEYKVG